jgi:ParB family chromosome partitioning protein
MGKLDELMKAAGTIAAESMGAGRVPAAMHRASSPPVASVPDRMEGLTRSRNAAEIPLAKIIPDPSQPREEFEPESLQRLADSLKTRGQLQPIRVRWDEAGGRYVIICGERRWRAAELAGLPTMSCVIQDTPLAPSELLTVMLLENLQREDLRPIEQAKAFRTLMDANGWSTRQLAAELAVTQSGVVRALALLDLPTVVQEQVEQGGLAPSVAYELSKVDGTEAQRELATRVVTEGLNRAEAVEAVRTAKTKGRGGSKGKAKSKGGRAVPTELKRKSSNGCRLIVKSTLRHDPEDIIAALREILDDLIDEWEIGTQDAA